MFALSLAGDMRERGEPRRFAFEEARSAALDQMTLILFVIGLVILIAGAELLVRGASRLAVTVGISPLVVGLTVVAFATSSPELAVSIGAAFSGQADLAVGNVVGSSIFNVLFVLGVSALIGALVVAQPLVRLEVPLLIGVSVLLLVLGLDGLISRWDGLLLSTGFVAYTVFVIRQSRKTSGQVEAEYNQEFGQGGRRGPRQTLIDVGLIVVGLAFLVLGARWLVNGAVSLARVLGLSELIIGLTIVAAGTSLPEVATSVIASIRKERDIAVGNVVGSNLFNILAVLGLTALVAPNGINVPAAALRFDLPFMIAVAIACLPIFFTGYRIARWEGALFLAYFVAYTLYLILDATEHDALPAYSTVLIQFVAPLTGVTLALLAVRAWRALLTSAGIKNTSIHDALVDLLGKPIAESSALCIPTAAYGHPMAGPVAAWRFISGQEPEPPCASWVGSPWACWSSPRCPASIKALWVPMVRETDVLLVNGGDPLYLCYWMRQSGLADLLPSLRETVWVGLSAGSMVMTPRIGEDFVGWKPPTAAAMKRWGSLTSRSFRTWITRICRKTPWPTQKDGPPACRCRPTRSTMRPPSK
jgi:cation:H+ antiporter